jgi:quinol monooxygenase YgiN
MIHVIATIQAADGRRGDLLAAFHQLVPLVRAEAGCLDYDPAIDVDAGLSGQPPARNNVLTVVEKWESVPALEDHLAAPHMLQFREKVGEIVESVEIRVLKPA